MKALVTGGNGLIGAQIVRALLERGHEPRALVRPTSRLDAIAGLPIEVARGDVLSKRDVARAARGCEILFHTAAHFTYGTDDLAALEQTAVGGSLSVLDAAKRAGVRRVVLTSSSVVFGYSRDQAVLDETRPLGAGPLEPPYVISKVRQDLAVLKRASQLGLEVVVACPTMSIGPFGTTLGPSNGTITTYLSDPWRLTYAGGCNLVSAADVGVGHVVLAERGSPGEHYLLGAENLHWREVHTLIADLAGVPPPRLLAGRATCQLVATAEEWRARMERRPALTTREQAGMVGRYYWYAHDKAATLGYAPRSARVAMAEAIAWLATSPHVTRAVRASMSIARDVYGARRSIAAREARLQPRRRKARTRAA